MAKADMPHPRSYWLSHLKKLAAEVAPNVPAPMAANLVLTTEGGRELMAAANRATSSQIHALG